jgi:hypothetical protein
VLYNSFAILGSFQVKKKKRNQFWILGLADFDILCFGIIC